MSNPTDDPQNTLSDEPSHDELREQSQDEQVQRQAPPWPVQPADEVPTDDPLDEAEPPSQA